MSTNVKRLLLVIISATLVPVIWGAGWWVYVLMEMWEWGLIDIEFQNILFILIGLQSFLFVAGAFKIKQPLSNFDKKYLNKVFKKAVSKIDPELDRHNERLTKIETDVADLKVAESLKPTKSTEAQ